MNTLKLFLIGYPIFIAIDFIWLGFLAKDFYRKQFAVFGQQVTLNLPAAVFAYVFLVLGIIIFVLPKNNQFSLSSFFWGGLFGLVAYGIYDLSNMATIAKWPLKLTLVDMSWGFVVCGLMALILRYISNKWI
jgi:uncharacterized membrane protein